MATQNSSSLISSVYKSRKIILELMLKQRYSIDDQVSDLLDDLLSTIPNPQRTQKVLNNIHIMIERFKQLREQFSTKDEFGNIDGVVVVTATYKPLIKHFRKFN